MCEPFWARSPYNFHVPRSERRQAVIENDKADPKAGRTDRPASEAQRPLPATGMPVSREDRRGWGLLSLALHILIIVLLVTDVSLHTGVVIEKPQGAGGPGPAGGGGGGHRGTGGMQEHVRYVHVAGRRPRFRRLS